MKKTITTIFAGLSLLSASAMNGLNIIGDGTLTGWDLDNTTTIPAQADNATLYKAIVYLNANQDFKFLTTYDWGNDEYGAAPGASMDADGTIALTMGKNDEGYGKLQVAEDGNYSITIDTEAMTATIVKAEYQETQIRYAALFMVGSATPGEWSLPDATVMYQNPAKPYEYATLFMPFKEGSFKIPTVIRGGGSFQNKFYYFKDLEDDGKMVLGQDGDNQWNLTAGSYVVIANTLDNTLVISDKPTLGAKLIVSENGAVTYYNLQGMPVANPANGLYLKRTAKGVEKVYIR